MFLSCPNCAVTYAVDSEALGQDGRSVRCSNCGHVWHQEAISDDDVMSLSSPAYPPSQPFYPPAGFYPPPYPPPSGTYPPPYPPPTGYYPPPYPGQPNTQQAPVGAGPSHGTGPQSGSDLAQASASATNAEQSAEAPIKDFSEDELDELFEEPEAIVPLQEEVAEPEAPDLSAEDLEDPEPIPHLQEVPKAEEDVQNPEDLEDPDPIPTVLSTPLDQDVGRKKKKGGAGKFFIFLLLFLLLLGGGAFALSKLGYLPSLDEALKLSGMEEDELGAGLEIRNIQTEVMVEDGVNLFEVRGTVANVSSSVREAPNIKVVLSDADQNEVESKVVTLRTNILDPRTITRFNIRFRDPPENATKMNVFFSTDPASGDTATSGR